MGDYLVNVGPSGPSSEATSSAKLSGVFSPQWEGPASGVPNHVDATSNAFLPQVVLEQVLFTRY